MDRDYTEILPVRTTLRWPWGLAIVHDSAWNEPPPPAPKADPFSATAGEILLAIQHEQEGEATVEFRANRPSDLALTAEIALDVPTGIVELTDVLKERVVTLRVGPGRWRVAVFMDEPKSATHVAIVLEGREGSSS